MTDRHSFSTPVPQPLFKFVGGDPSLDFVNTIDWTARGPARERLTDYSRLTRWAANAGVLSKPEAEKLRRLARAKPVAAEAATREARRLRSVLSGLFRAVVAGARSAAAWEDFNRALAGAVERLRLAPRAGARRAEAAEAAWSWSESAESLASPLWPVVWSAARLLTSGDCARIRVCGGADCGWLYVDRSRNGLRRWCEMETCGTREKSRRRRERQASSTDRSRRRARETALSRRP